MDRCTVRGFRDRRRPILSAAAFYGVDQMARDVLSSSLEWTTVLRRLGRGGDVQHLNGDGLLNLLVFLQAQGAPVQAFIDRRRKVSRKQLALLHVARSKVSLSDDLMTWTLQHLGGVNSAADLDARGFDLAMAVMRHRGFEWRENIDRAGLPIGHRPRFASTAQLGLIRELWAEWSGGQNEAALAGWLERSYQVSALRFLTSVTASGAITALKAMKRRKVKPSKVSA